MNMGFENMNFPAQKKNVQEKPNNERRIELFREAEERAKELYGDIPYHNYDHAMDAVDAGYEIVAHCQASNVEVNSDLIFYASLFHDAGYHEDHEAKGFESKEEYSAHLAEETLLDMGIEQNFIDSVKRCIVSTHKDKSFDFLEEKIVRAADLSGLAADYETFRDNAKKLKEEAELLSGSEISMENWKTGVNEIIGFYLTQDIRLTECYKDEEGGSRFHKRANANLGRFLSEE